MKAQPETIIFVNGTVRDALNIYALADKETQKNLYAAIRGAGSLDQEIKIQVGSQDEADKLVSLSHVYELPVRKITVRSMSRPGILHTIYYKGNFPVACSCESFAYSSATVCKHIKEALLRGITPPNEGSTD